MKQQNCTDTISSGPRFPELGRLWLAWLVRRMQSVAERLMEWPERSRQRRHLAAMDDYMLRDIGLTRADVRTETEKWFWQP